MKSRKNHWGFEGLNGDSLINQAVVENIMTVCKFWTPDERAWDKDDI